MIAILQYLFIIRFRKLVPKGDKLAVLLIILFYFGVAFLVYQNYMQFRNYILLFFLDVVGYHLQRSDIEILKLHKNYKTILFFEYLIYSLPFHLVLLFKQEFLFISIILLFDIVLINLPKSNFKTIPYPFHLFNVHWHISFRRYKLIYITPFLTVLIYLSTAYKNQNLIYFVLLILAVIACVPSFEREKTDDIKRNPFSPEKYLLFQLKNTLINTFYIALPFAIIFCFLEEWEKLLLTGIVFIPPLLNVVLKYIYFNNTLIHQIVFTLITTSSVLFFGAPLLTVPFLYKKAIKNLNTLKYAED